MKILLIGDDPRKATGFGKVTRQLMTFLSEEHDVYTLAYAPMPEPITEKGLAMVGDPNVLMSTDKPILEEDMYGRYSAAILASRMKVDMILTVGDLWYFPYIKTLRAAMPNMIFAGYFPNEALSLPIEVGVKVGQNNIGFKMRDLMNAYDHLIAYSRFSMEQAGGNCKHFIYHSALDDEMAKTSEVDLSKFEDKFVIGTVMRTQYRKAPDQMFELLRIMKDNYPDAYDKVLLYIHSARFDAHKIDLYQMARTFDVEDKLLLTDDVYPHVFRNDVGQVDINISMPREQLNAIVKRFNVYLAPSYAEGFNLPLLEAANLGVPVMYHEIGTMGEIMKELGTPIKTLCHFIGRTEDRIFGMPDMSQAAKRLNEAITQNRPLETASPVRLKERFSDKVLKKKWLKIIGSMKKIDYPNPEVLIIYQKNTAAELVLNKVREKYVDKEIMEIDSTIGLLEDLPLLSLSNTIETVELIHAPGSVGANVLPLFPDKFCIRRQVEINLNVLSTDVSVICKLKGVYTRMRVLPAVKKHEKMKHFFDEPTTLIEELPMPQPSDDNGQWTDKIIFIGAIDDNYGLTPVINSLDCGVIVRELSSSQSPIITESFSKRCRALNKPFITDRVEDLPRGATIYKWHIKDRAWDVYLEILKEHNHVIIGSRDRDKIKGVVVCKDVNEFIEKIKNKHSSGGNT